ncbi:MAG: hypothetical protein LBH55_03070 [Mycoplasmataceae bacterium]|jgi:gas vesicle protein|nr:hypothetical protein [Mycoplasmataceae bacterium]
MPMRREVKIVETENEYVKVGDTFIVEMGKHKGSTGGNGGEPRQKKPKTKLPSLRELIMQMQVEMKGMQNNISNIQSEIKEMKQDFNNKIDNIQTEVKEMKQDFNNKIDNIQAEMKGMKKDFNEKIDKVIKLNGLKTE